MEHIIIEYLSDGYVRLTPEEGYQLFSLALQRFVSEAVVEEKQMNQFTTKP